MFQQIQLMKLLQIPTAILDQRIKEELESNPALEEGDTADDEFLETARNGEESKTEGETGEEPQESENEDLDRDELPPEEEVSLDDYLTDYIEDDEAGYKLRADNYGQEDENKTLPIAVEDTFHE